MRPTGGRRQPITALACGLFGALSSLPCPAATTLDCDAAETVEAPLALAQGAPDAAVDVQADRPAWLEIEEAGLSANVATAQGDELLRIDVPPRHGWLFLRVHGPRTIRMQRHDPGTRAGAFRLTLHCDPDASARDRIAWFARAAPVATRLQSAASPETYAELVAAVDALLASASDRPTMALASHLHAQMLLMNGRDVDAAKEFAGVEQAWTNLGDTQRAEAARVARVAEAYYSADYASVLALTAAHPAGRDAQSYYRVRSQYERCLALSRMARRDEAAPCYEWVIAAFDQLDERADYVNALLSYAGAEIARDRIDAAERLATKAASLVEGPNTTLLRGRAETTLADLSLRRGAIPESVAHSDRALTAFGELRDARWEANVLLKLADLHGELGAYDEAWGFLADAARRLSARDAPARVAAAITTMARLAQASGSPEVARWSSRAAEESYTSLGMPVEADGARIARAELELLADDEAAADSAVHDARARPENAARRARLAIALALRQGRLADARAALDQQRSGTAGLRDGLRMVELEARYWLKAGEPSRAENLLLDAAQHVVRLADSATSQALHLLIVQQIRPLRRLAFDIVLSQPDDGAFCGRCERLWPWLALADARRATAAESPDRRAGAFDRAVAAELLATSATPASEAASRRELVRLLAEPAGAGEPQPAATAGLADLQRSLGEDALLLAAVDGEERAALLAITPTSARILDLPHPARVRALSAAAHAAARSPDIPVAQVDAAAQALSAALLASFNGNKPPHRLLVLRGDLLDAVPWPLLYWPGHSTPLLDTTRVALVSPSIAPREPVAASGEAGLAVVVAAQEHSAESRLPHLANAADEAAFIEHALPDGARTVERVEDATPARVLTLLAEPGRWVHIAAHGTTLPVRLGYSGIWMESASPAGTKPEFLSWLDIVEQGLHADLVVLDACSLGDAGDTGSSHPSFAAAMSRAGVNQVVAAMWPVSDTASATWVPAFYAAIGADPQQDAVAALREAQLKLRTSRMFRHPFYWAGLQAFSRLELASSTRLPHRSAPER